MAWIESHQDLATNPKTRRLSRLLDITLAQTVGHLHLLWWWTLDHAFDGDLSEFDAIDIAEACDWHGDEDGFVIALQQCGPRDKAGFLTEAMRVNDWSGFTKHLAARRDASSKAHHTRWHERRNMPDPDCEWCANAVRTHGDRTSDAGGSAMHQPTNQPTNQPKPPVSTDVATPSKPKAKKPPTYTDDFNDFWAGYPRHPDNGKPGGGGTKLEAWSAWGKLGEADRVKAVDVLDQHARALRKSNTPPKHAHRFLNLREFDSYDEVRAARAARVTSTCGWHCGLADDDHDDALCRTVTGRARNSVVVDFSRGGGAA